MKTTVEIPDSLFRQAKTAAAKRGLSLKNFLTEALKEKLAAAPKNAAAVAPPHMNAFGGLRRWHAETRRVQRVIDQEFSRINAEDWK